MFTIEEMYGAAFQYALDKATELAIDGAVNESVKAWVRRAERKTAANISEDLRAPWGPERAMLSSTNSEAPHPAFNRHSANPNYGDERVIAIAKDTADTTAGGWKARITVVPGHTYVLRLYYHNSADLTAVATGARALCNIPNAAATKAQVTAFIVGENTVPPAIWSSLLFESSDDKPFRLRYVPGSTNIFTNNVPSGWQCGDGIISTEGVLLGDELDGVVPGGYQTSGIVTFQVVADERNYSTPSWLDHTP